MWVLCDVSVSTESRQVFVFVFTTETQRHREAQRARKHMFNISDLKLVKLKSKLETGIDVTIKMKNRKALHIILQGCKPILALCASLCLCVSVVKNKKEDAYNCKLSTRMDKKKARRWASSLIRIQR